MQVGRVAQSTGLSVDTIRFYEKQGLDRLQLIGRAHSLGLSLQEISELLLIEDGDPLDETEQRTSLGVYEFSYAHATETASYLPR